MCIRDRIPIKFSPLPVALIKAESSNPKGDVWFGGTGDPHLTAAQENLTAEYKSKHFNDLLPAAQNQAVNANYKSVGIYVGALGFGYNKELLAKKGLPAPKSWMDLTKPIYKGEIQIANPNSSGTAYTTLATIIQIFGEDKGWDYMKALHLNVNTYTKSCLLYTSPSPRDRTRSRMPSSA